MIIHKVASALLSETPSLPPQGKRLQPIHQRQRFAAATKSIRRFISLAKEKKYESIQYP